MGNQLAEISHSDDISGATFDLNKEWLMKSEWDKNVLIQKAKKKEVAPFEKPKEEEKRGHEMCLICMLFFKKGLNRCCQCDQSICSSCYFRIKQPPIGERWIDESKCPFCNNKPFEVVFRGRYYISEKERIEAKRESARIENLQMKAEQKKRQEKKYEDTRNEIQKIQELVLKEFDQIILQNARNHNKNNENKIIMNMNGLPEHIQYNDIKIVEQRISEQWIEKEIEEKRMCYLERNEEILNEFDLISEKRMKEIQKLVYFSVFGCLKYLKMKDLSSSKTSSSNLFLETTTKTITKNNEKEEKEEQSSNKKGGEKWEEDQFFDLLF